MRNKCVFVITQEVSDRIQRISEKTQLTKGEILEKLIDEQDIDKRITVKKTATAKNDVKVNWYISSQAFEKLSKLATINNTSRSMVCQMLVSSLIDAKVEMVIEYQQSY